MPCFCYKSSVKAWYTCSSCSVGVRLYKVQPYSRCMYSCACGQHLCMCGRACGWQREYMEINASSCSLYTSNAALLLARQRSDKARARGSKANETAIAQTHPADPWILIRLRREMEAGCLHSLNSSPINERQSGGRGSKWGWRWVCGAVLYVGRTLGCEASP